MRGLLGVGVVPHPPVLVPEIGGERLRELEATIAAMAALAAEVRALRPRTVVIVSPHGEVMPGAVGVEQAPRLEGDFGAFGRPDCGFSMDNDLMLARTVAELAKNAGLPVRLGEGGGRSLTRPARLHYAFLVPWYFLAKAGVEARCLPLTVAGLPTATLYRAGSLLTVAAEQTATGIVVLASADLSHRLTADAPAGYHPKGREFDAEVIGALRDGEPRRIVELDPNLAEQAGECGWRPIVMALGSLAGRRFESRVLSYEGPFGVGYGVAILVPSPGNGTDLAGLARRALATYLREGRVPEETQDAGPAVRIRAGAFVSIKHRGRLRGCMGTVEPTCSSLADEVARNAVRAGTEDPRFPAVTLAELDALEFVVDVMGELEPVRSVDELDPRCFGVLVRCGARSGVLLPALEGVKTREEQLEIALAKAGLRGDEPGLRLYRFRTTRHREGGADR